MLVTRRALDYKSFALAALHVNGITRDMSSVKAIAADAGSSLREN